MSRIARSKDPLYVTKGRPFSFPMRLTNPDDGTPIVLTGALVESVLKWAGASSWATVGSRVDADGRFTVSGTALQTQNIPLGRLSELLVTVTDAHGGVVDYVYPVEGETP